MLVTTQSLFNKWMYVLVIFAAAVTLMRPAVTKVLSDSCNCWCLIDGLWVCLTRCNTISTVQMISAEAPVLFAKAAQIFITELTLRAWIHTEDNKRRTLQVIDISFFFFIFKLLHMTCFFVILSKSYFKWIGPPDTHTAPVVMLTWPFFFLSPKFIPFPTLWHQLAIFLVSCFLFTKCQCQCACTSREPIPASPWGLSLC